MKQFNVLDRHLKIHQHYLLEASAGTGKTFSIQNIVLRLLIESQEDNPPLSLQKILVVTFTRAATRDLKERIRANIEQALSFLQSWLFHHTLDEKMPDYLKAFIERDESDVLAARKHLQQALFTFDQAQIFTIHGFCARMLKQFALESDMKFDHFSGEEPLPYTEIMEIILDYFRTEIRLEHFSPAQLDILIRGDPDQKKLYRAIQTGHLFPLLPSFQETYLQFIACMQALKKSWNLDSTLMLNDFKEQAPYFKNYQAGVTKADVLEKIQGFVRLFDKSEWSVEDLDELIYQQVVWVKALDPCLYKGKGLETCQLSYPDLTQDLRENLYPLIENASQFSTLLLRMAKGCHAYLQRYQHEEEKLAPDDILRKMHWALSLPDFLTQVRLNYDTAIIDEFQDTDPLQWQIFKRLFLADSITWKGFLYLVGDPKQSIYSFRQADIYTYLSAARALGENHCFSLDINFRSQPSLVEALNHLFSPDNLPDFIPLPKHSFHLPYHPVKASQRLENNPFKNNKNAVHFFIADGQAFIKPRLVDLETHVFFPFISQEIKRLKEENRFRFDQFAVLVRDRHQALRLAQFFDQLHIPYLNQRGISLAETDALQSFIHLIQAVLKPHDRGAIRLALGGAIFGWTYEDVQALKKMDDIQFFIQKIRYTLFEKGVVSFFEEVLHAQLKDNRTVQECILSRQRGLELLRDLNQIVDLIIAHHRKDWHSPEGIVAFLDQFQIWEKNEDSRVKRFLDPFADGVKILTLHFCKGLEFDVVFALGLVNRTNRQEDFFPVETEGEIILTPLSQSDSVYQYLCEENDAEKMRQLYVAFTRAKFQLYIPIALHLPSETISKGEASPLDLFLARLNYPQAEYHEVYERIRSYCGKNLIDFLDRVGKDHFMSYSIHQEIDCDPYLAPMENPPPLYSPKKIELSFESLWMSSFSSLRAQEKHTSSQSQEALPKDYSHTDKTIHTLPANQDTGLFIHSILQKINFCEFKSSTPVAVTNPFVQSLVQNSLFKEWEDVISHLIFNTLNVSLPHEGSSFKLADIDSALFFKEMAFMYPYSEDLKIEETVIRKGMIKGIIDLLFYHNNLYYLIDWKTNWLGTQTAHYNQENMFKAMHENAYFLQVSLYLEAIKRYLKIVDKRPFEECFGGSYYLFLRGIKIGETTGIVYLPNKK